MEPNPASAGLFVMNSLCPGPPWLRAHRIISAPVLQSAISSLDSVHERRPHGHVAGPSRRRRVMVSTKDLLDHIEALLRLSRDVRDRAISAKIREMADELRILISVADVSDVAAGLSSAPASVAVPSANEMVTALYGTKPKRRRRGKESASDASSPNITVAVLLFSGSALSEPPGEPLRQRDHAMTWCGLDLLLSESLMAMRRTSWIDQRISDGRGGAICGFCRGSAVRFFVGGGGLARWRIAAIMAKASVTRETWRCHPCQDLLSLCDRVRTSFFCGLKTVLAI